jgi:hypothetical protein
MTSERIMVDMALLDQAGKAANRAILAIQYAQIMQAEGDQAVALRLSDANEDAQSAYLLLRQLGAHVPDGPSPRPVAEALLDTHNVRRLVEALDEALRAAEAVDRERGWTAGGVPCGFTDSVLDLIYRVKG